MARQKTKSSDKFGSGGSKDGSPEEKFFTGDVDIQIDPEWKAMEMLRTSIDDLTDVVNANDAASGSYASLKKEYTTASGSFSTRVTTNDAKVTSPFPALTTTQAKTTVEINSITHAAAASVDATDTLIIVVAVTSGKTTTKKTFVLNASS